MKFPELLPELIHEVYDEEVLTQADIANGRLINRRFNKILRSRALEKITIDFTDSPAFKRLHHHLQPSAPAPEDNSSAAAAESISEEEDEGKFSTELKGEEREMTDKLLSSPALLNALDASRELNIRIHRFLFPPGDELSDKMYVLFFTKAASEEKMFSALSTIRTINLEVTLTNKNYDATLLLMWLISDLPQRPNFYPKITTSPGFLDVLEALPTDSMYTFVFGSPVEFPDVELVAARGSLARILESTPRLTYMVTMLLGQRPMMGNDDVLSEISTKTIAPLENLVRVDIPLAVEIVSGENLLKLKNLKFLRIFEVKAYTDQSVIRFSLQCHELTTSKVKMERLILPGVNSAALYYLQRVPNNIKRLKLHISASFAQRVGATERHILRSSTFWVLALDCLKDSLEELIVYPALENGNAGNQVVCPSTTFNLAGLEKDADIEYMRPWSLDALEDPLVELPHLKRLVVCTFARSLARSMAILERCPGLVKLHISVFSLIRERAQRITGLMNTLQRQDLEDVDGYPGIGIDKSRLTLPEVPKPGLNLDVRHVYYRADNEVLSDITNRYVLRREKFRLIVG